MKKILIALIVTLIIGMFIYTVAPAALYMIGIDIPICNVLTYVNNVPQTGHLFYARNGQPEVDFFYNNEKYTCRMQSSQKPRILYLNMPEPSGTQRVWYSTKKDIDPKKNPESNFCDDRVAEIIKQ